MNEQLEFLPCPRWISIACGPRDGLATPVIVWPARKDLAHVLGAQYKIELNGDQSVRRRLRDLMESLAIVCRGVATDVRGTLSLFVLDPDPEVENIVREGRVDATKLESLREVYDRIDLCMSWRYFNTDGVQHVDLSFMNNGTRERAWTRVPLDWGLPVVYPKGRT